MSQMYKYLPTVQSSTESLKDMNEWQKNKDKAEKIDIEKFFKEAFDEINNIQNNPNIHPSLKEKTLLVKDFYSIIQNNYTKIEEREAKKLEDEIAYQKSTYFNMADKQL